MSDAVENLIAKVEGAPRMAADAYATYDKVCARIHRAERDLERATDDAARTRARARVEKNRAAKRALVAPYIAHQPAPPTRIVMRFERAWWRTNFDGLRTSVLHVQLCDMALMECDLSGPLWRTTRTILNEGAPPWNATSAPTSCGVAWHAVHEYIASGKIVPLPEVS